MIRLGLLMAVTLVALAGVLLVWGDGDLRAARRPAAPAPVSAATDAGAPALTAPAAGSLPSRPTVPIVPAASQTPERTQRFPGPALQPSPEFAGAPTPTSGADPRTGADGPILHVTGDRVNMRAGAGTGNPVVASLTRGDVVTATGPVGDDWVQVRTVRGQQGFVAARFLSGDAP